MIKYLTVVAADLKNKGEFMESNKFFEMIYHSGPEDFESDFYKENNKKTRKHFFEQMLKAGFRKL